MTPDSIADGLSAPFAGENALAILRAHGVESVLVTEDEIEEAFRFLYERAKLACEPAAAVGRRRAPSREDRAGDAVGVVVSGGNVAPKRPLLSWLEQ